VKKGCCVAVQKFSSVLEGFTNASRFVDETGSDNSADADAHAPHLGQVPPASSSENFPLIKGRLCLFDLISATCGCKRTGDNKQM
jgi:hypothetical protein